MKNLLLTTICLLFCIAPTMAANAPKTDLDGVLKAYFDTKNALAGDRTAEKEGQILMTALKDFSTKKLTAAQKADWKTESQEVMKSIQPMLAESTLKAQRGLFKAVSNSMIKLLGSVKLTEGKIYVQYCPMAKASWLNEVEAVQNPYYGSGMYSCGSVKNRI